MATTPQTQKELTLEEKLAAINAGVEASLPTVRDAEKPKMACPVDPQLAAQCESCQ